MRTAIQHKNQTQQSSKGSQPFFSPAFIQPKLTIGAPNDKYEQEADATADKVMRMSQNSPAIQTKCAGCEQEEKMQVKPMLQKMGGEEEEMMQTKPLIQKMGGEEEEMMQTKPMLQKMGGKEEEKPLQTKPLMLKSEGGGGVATQALSTQLNSSKGSGNSLPGSTNSFMSQAFGSDFSNVKVHTDSNAVQMNQGLNAKAFTHGSDIYFNKGQYSPESSDGKKLLAHELTHVVQQGGGSESIQKDDLTSPRLAGNPLFENVLDNTAVIEFGDRGREVRRMQQMLIDLGFNLSQFGADGDYGTETKNAIKAFQISRGLDNDGRVGFNTIRALNDAFPAVALPTNISDPWTMACILQILCPWNRNLVENVLPTFNIITFDSRTFPTETWNGTSWVAGTFTSGGFRGGTNMGFLNTTTCQEMAFTIYHEGWHGQQPSGLTGVVEAERDAYINAEQWSIDMGIPGQGTFTNEATGAVESFRTPVGGETSVNETAAETFVRQEYGGVSSIPGERILARVGATDVRVRRANGTEYVRPAQAGESVRGAVVMTNQNPIDPSAWICP